MGNRWWRLRLSTCVALAGLISASLLIAAHVALAAPPVITVTAGGDATNSASDCPAITNTTCTLRDAIDKANATGNAGATIIVPAETITLSASYGELRIVQPVTITGAGDSTSGTVIKQTGGDGDRDLEIYDESAAGVGQVTISGVEFTGGNLTDSAADDQTALAGGAILIDPNVTGESVTLSNDLITDNTVTGATGTNPGSLFEDGQSAEGGGIDLNGQSPTLTLNATTVSDDSAAGGNGVAGGTTAAGGAGGGASGGGISADYGTLIIENGSSLTGDLAYGGSGGTGGTNESLYPPGVAGAASGGAVETSSAVTLTLTGSVLTDDNAAGTDMAPGAGGSADGGALSLSGTATIADDTFGDDAATGGAAGGSYTVGAAYGGAVAIYEPGVNIATSTFDDDTVGGYYATGGAVWVGSTGATIVNSTISGNGNSDTATGGGVTDDDTVALANDTITDNTVGSGGAGANIYAEGGTTELADTIVAAPAGAANCAAEGGQGSFADLGTSGHNLEDDAGASCGFSTATGDLVGVTPQLGQLANNGGATQTLLPAVGSPVIAAGGACSDPSNSSAPLLVDQRADPRPSGGPCDIGAVQIQPPLNTTAPSIAPLGPAYGQQLTCSAGTWSADGSVNYAYSWLRNGTAISGATASTYQPVPADVNQPLSCHVVGTSPYAKSAGATSAAVRVTAPGPGASIQTPATGATYAQGQVVDAAYSCSDPSAGTGLASCVGTTAQGAAINTATVGSHSFTVTATDASGQTASQTSTYTVTASTAATMTPTSTTSTSTAPGGTTTTGATSSPTGGPRLSGVSESARRWRESGKPGTGKPAVGTTFRFTLTAPATVTLTFERSLPGRRVHGRCVALDHANRNGARCTRTVTLGALSAHGKTGPNTLIFHGTVSRLAKLAPGSYTVSFTATGAASVTRPFVLRFTIVR